MLKLVILSSCAPLALPAVHGLDKKPCASMPWKCRLFLLRVDALDWSKEPVLLHFFISVGTTESGVNSDVRERLFSVADKCSLLRVWWQMSLHVPMSTSSSEGFVESCWGQLWLALSPPMLLWLLCCLWVAWSVAAELCLLSKEGPWSAVGLRLGCSERLGRGQKRDSGRSRFWSGEMPELSPSSTVLCRLPSELPVARDESLWNRCWTIRQNI